MIGVLKNQQVVDEIKDTVSRREYIILHNTASQTVSDESSINFPEIKAQHNTNTFEVVTNINGGHGIKILKAGTYLIKARLTMLNVPLNFFSNTCIVSNFDVYNIITKQFGFITQLDPTPFLMCPVSTTKVFNAGDIISVAVFTTQNNIQLSNLPNLDPYFAAIRLN